MSSIPAVCPQYYSDGCRSDWSLFTPLVQQAPRSSLHIHSSSLCIAEVVAFTKGRKFIFIVSTGPEVDFAKTKSIASSPAVDLFDKGQTGTNFRALKIKELLMKIKKSFTVFLHIYHLSAIMNTRIKKSHNSIFYLPVCSPAVSGPWPRCREGPPGALALTPRHLYPSCCLA